MNEINVDCQNVVKNFSSLLTIEDLYNNANYSIPNDQVITSLSIDEEVNDPGESFAFLKSKIANFQHVSFNTQSKKIVLEEAFLSADKLIRSLSQNIQELVKEDNFGQNKEFTILCLDHVFSRLGMFNQLISHSNHLIKDSYNKNLYGVSFIKKIQIHHLSILKMMKKANESQDHIMLRDLLEYELLDNLNLWSKKIIPFVMKQIENE